MSYSYLREDDGYYIYNDAKIMHYILPLVHDVEPRIIYFLRTLYYHKKYNIKHCVPLYMQFMIKKEDWDVIVYYIKKYNIKVFNRYI
jgi:hypothetical protein